ncbi:MAG: tetratricopeptide repeat-containing glycosyltransferase family protein [Xanthobacteraceae bacterium]|nr:tetratricopeptide repeat-containing glycosyltransferase family protein [Xanthobacteraceae bacterium]
MNGPQNTGPQAAETKISQTSATPAADPLQEALALHRAGKHDLAMQRYVALLQKDPDNADVLYYVAVLAVQEGQFAEGAKVIRRALAVGKPQARLYNLLGQLHLRQNQDEDALRAFGQAIETDPAFPDAYGNRGALLAEMKRFQEAFEDLNRAIKLRQNNATDLCNHGGVLSDLGRLDEALRSLNRALELMPKLAPALYNRAEVLSKLGRHAEALADYDRAIAIFPNNAGAHSNRAAVLKQLGRLDEARAAIDQALAIDPNSVETITNRGNIAFQQGRLDDAMADYDRALQAKPDFAEAHHGRGLACLTRGDWDAGFKDYEYRDRLKTPVYQPLPHPRWGGDAAPGERLLLLCEQGLGDTIQFSRFAPLLAAQGRDVTLLAPANMQRLLSTLEGVTVARMADAPPVNGDSLGRPTRWLPLMSVPGVLGVRPDTIPAMGPYLKAEPTRVETWSAWLGGERSGSEGFRIGINWGIGTVPVWFSRLRDVPLAAFAPLVEISGARLISLQMGGALSQIGLVPFGAKIEQPGDSYYADMGAFLDTAALMMSLDLIVTCDTSVAHLAGALGRPVFVALPAISDWRWLTGRDDTPWYPTMRLFRQDTPGDWNGVFARIAAAVAEMAEMAGR